MNVKRLVAAIDVGACTLAALALLRLLLSAPQPTVAQTATGVIRVATTGSDVPGCGGSANPCATIQYAVDLANTRDEVHVARGVYNDLHIRPRNDLTTTGIVTQIVYISKTVIIRGGYTTTDWSASNPISYPTTLDAQGQGRVLYITGNISPTIEGLRITGGDATGLGSGLAAAFAEGHFPITVEGAAGIDAYRQGGELSVLAPAAGEKVSHRTFHGRMFLIIPVYA